MAVFVACSNQPFGAGMWMANHSLGPGFQKISLPASRKWDSPVIFIWTRTAVHGQSLQAHTSFDILCQVHLLLATLVVTDRLHLQTTTAGQSSPTRQTSEYACNFTSQTLGMRGMYLPITAVRESHSVCRSHNIIRSYSKVAVLPFPRLSSKDAGREYACCL